MTSPNYFFVFPASRYENRYDLHRQRHLSQLSKQPMQHAIRKCCLKTEVNLFNCCCCNIAKLTVVSFMATFTRFLRNREIKSTESTPTAIRQYHLESIIMSNTTRGAMNNANRYHPNAQQTMSSTSMIAPDGTMLLSEEEIERIMDNFANEDTAYDKTWTRIVVENILSKVRFVFLSFPHLNALNILKRALLWNCLP